MDQQSESINENWPATYKQFAIDMQEAGIRWIDYQGRYHYDGPAAPTDEDKGPTLQDVIRATKVKVQWDQLGLHHIVYPV